MPSLTLIVRFNVEENRSVRLIFPVCSLHTSIYVCVLKMPNAGSHIIARPDTQKHWCTHWWEWVALLLRLL